MINWALTNSSFGSCLAMLFSNDTVGFLAVSSMSSTFLSPRSSKPLARIPTLITPFNSRAGFSALTRTTAHKGSRLNLKYISKCPQTQNRALKLKKQIKYCQLVGLLNMTCWLYFMNGDVNSPVIAIITWATFFNHRCCWNCGAQYTTGSVSRYCDLSTLSSLLLTIHTKQ